MGKKITKSLKNYDSALSAGRVYVVEASSGRHDDFRWWIEYISKDPLKAKKYREKVLEDIKIAQNVKCPIKGVTGYENVPKNMSDEDWNKWHDWQVKKDDADDFNWCKVKEYELDSPCE